LLSAVEQGDLSTIKELINQGADINARDFIGRTALMRACFAKNLDIVNEFIAQGADVNKYDFNRSTALMYACRQEDLDIVNALIAGGANLDAPPFEKQTPLMIAVDRNNLEIVRSLIGTGLIDINLRGHGGLTVLMNAVKNRCTEIVKVILDFQPDLNLSNANPKSPRPFGKTAIMFAFESQDPDIIKLLIDAHINDGDNGVPIPDEVLYQAVYFAIEDQEQGLPLLELLLSKQIHSKPIFSHDVLAKGLTIALNKEESNLRVILLLLLVGADVSALGDDQRAKLIASQAQILEIADQATHDRLHVVFQTLTPSSNSSSSSSSSD